ncbi:hypothetical protein [Ornithinimicrobium panacihumi]|uniref:hypothetical protein n=1 Tax=Ornithinimicrobium panacihumi TaxID=2008449 RepID=UPI003F89492F
MSDQPLFEEEPRRPDEPAFQPDPPSIWAVVLGVLAGFVAAFAFPLMMMPLLDNLSLAGGQVGFLAVTFGLPLLGLIVLLVPSWRRAGAGFVMGMAIGSIVFAGVCAAFITSFNA